MPVSENRPENPDFEKFQNAVKIALVDEFQWNLWQMRALGLVFSDFFLNFRKFLSCFTALWTSATSGFSKMMENTKCARSGDTFLAKINIFFEILKFQLFSARRELQTDAELFYISILHLELKFETWSQFSDFPDFPSFPYIKSLRKIFLNEFI